MTHDENLIAQLRDLDQPVEPDREFARSLQQRFLTEASPARLTLVPTAIQTTRSRTSGGRGGTGKRILDLAAVAVILLSMIGGLARSTTTGGDPGTPTIEAPGTSRPPVMVGGTAAQGNQYSGPAPTADRYELAWQIQRSEGANLWPVLSFGDLVYALYQSDNRLDHAALRAYDLTTGTKVWDVPVSPIHGFAVTSEGVVVAVEPASNATYSTDGEGNPIIGEPIQIALLDLLTGRRIWTTEQSWGNYGERGRSTVIVDQQSIWFADGFGAVVELDMANGAVSWTYTYDRDLGPGIDEQTCYPGVVSIDQICFDRLLYPILLAANDDYLYVGDRLMGTFVALNSSDGAEQWTVDFLDRNPVYSDLLGISAINDGALVMFGGNTPESPDWAVDLAVWNESDGSERWSKVGPYHAVLVSDGESVIVQNLTDESIRLVTAFDLLSGEMKWAVTVDDSVVAGYLTESRTVIFNETAPVGADVGVDFANSVEAWYMPYFDGDCAPIYPLPANGYVVCTGPEGGLLVLRPVTDPEASPVATPSPGR